MRCNMPQTLLGWKKYEEAISYEHSVGCPIEQNQQRVSIFLKKQTCLKNE